MEHLMEKFGGLSQTNILVAVVVTVVAISIAVLTRSKPSRGRLPPGPRGWPLVGSLFALGHSPHLAFERLSKQYAPIFYLYLGQQPIVILCSVAVATEALKTKDTIFSNRPDVPLAFNYMTDTPGLAWTKLGTVWKTMRRVCNTELLTVRRLQTPDFQNIRQSEVRATVLGVLYEWQQSEGKPVDVSGFVRRLTYNNISRMIMGRRFYATEKSEMDTGLTEFDPDLQGYALFQEFFELMGEPNIADYIPFLRPLDPKGLRKRGTAYKKKIRKYIQSIFDQYENKQPSSVESAKLSKLSDKGNFVEQLVKLQPENVSEKDRLPLHEYLSNDGMKALIWDMIAAGTDTSSTTLKWSFSELARNPHIMKRLHDELDTVVGRNRLVEEADLPKLKYLQAVTRETMRLHPSVTIIPRATTLTEDCEVAGYHIPANSRVFIDTWTIQRDPTVWENALEYNPDRFLNSNIEFNGQSLEFLPFGTGRRACPGYNLVVIVVQYSLAQMLHTFNWELLPGQKSEDVDMTASGGFVNSKDKPLFLVAKPRLSPDLIRG